jgi:DNA-binding NarL/FixJ family response regulator
MSPYRIVLADDHVLLRHGIKSIIETSKDIKVVGEADDGLELLEVLKCVTADMVILDISMPNLRGFEATCEIKSGYPDIKILILSMHKQKEYLYHAFSAGAAGYLLKEDTDTELFTAIETVRNSELYVSPLLQKEITSDLLEMRGSAGKGADEGLTTREKEVLKLIAEGKSSKEIAILLFISSRTVEHHRASMMKKLQLRTIADLVKYAIQKGYITIGRE